MATIVIAATVVLACSALVGQGICVLGGRAEWAWWAPGVGFAALVAVAGALIRAPGHDKTVAVAIAVATLASLASRRTRAALRSALPDALPIAAFTLFASTLPFLVSGRAGMLGVGVNNDLSAHLGTAWWLVHERGPVPVGATGGGALAHVGYPIGPHGLAAALSLGHISLVHAFDAVIVVVPALMALVALGVARGAPRGLRWLAAVLVGLCYLVAAYTSQASFKETMEALFVVAAILAARDTLADPDARGWRAGIPIGVVCAGSVWVYSYVGLTWTVGAVVAVALTSGALGRAIAAAPGALAGGALVLAPAVPAMLKFASSPFYHDSGNGNLGHELNPLEALNVWLGSDFRWTPNPLWPTILLAAVAALAAVIAIYRLIRAHQLALPAALIPTLAIVAWAFARKSPYVSAKTLMIAAPVVMLTTVGGLLLPVGQRTRSLLPIATAAIAFVAAGAALVSSFWALRDGWVDPVTHAAELARLRPLVAGNERVLIMDKADLAEWEFVGLQEYKPGSFYAPLWVTPQGSKPTRPGGGGFYDFDSFDSATLDRFRYAIAPRSPFQSLPPPNWRPIARTRSYTLWRRSGPTPYRIPADFADRPGRILLCDRGFARRRLAAIGPRGYAVVSSRPVIGRQVQWSGEARYSGDSASMTLSVPRGTWDLALEYASEVGISVQAGHLRADMPASMERVGPFWYVGTLRKTQPGPLTVRVTQKRMNLFARLLGARGLTRALDSPSTRPLKDVVLTRHVLRTRRVRPAARACGHWVDYFVPGGS